jgi:hypothetical protein
MPCAGPGNREKLIDYMIEELYPIDPDLAPILNWHRIEEAIRKAAQKYFNTTDQCNYVTDELLMGALALYGVDNSLPKEWFREKMKEFDINVCCYSF